MEWNKKSSFFLMVLIYSLIYIITYQLLYIITLNSIFIDRPMRYTTTSDRCNPYMMFSLFVDYIVGVIFTVH